MKRNNSFDSRLRFFSWAISLCLLFTFIAVPAHATLIGDTVDCSTTGSSWSCDAPSATVTDPGIEFGIFVHSFFHAIDLDITDNSLNFDVLLGVLNISGIGPLSISSIDSVITGFTFDTNIVGMDASRLSFTSSSFNANFDGLTIKGGNDLNINLQFANAVPEPGTMLLLGSGLAGLVAFRKKFKK